VKFLDRRLRDARIARCRPYIRPGDALLDVGCADGEMLRRLRGLISYGVGIEPTLDARREGDGYVLLPGRFPDAVPSAATFDVITLLAVLEHMPPAEQARLAGTCANLLATGGRIVITVPSPRVDDILHLLIRLRLIEGMGVHEHYGFRPGLTPGLFPAPTYRMAAHRRFQLGLNNLFVFEKVADLAPAAAGPTAPP